MANPLDTLLQKVRSNVSNTASRLFGQAKGFVQQNPTPAGFVSRNVPQINQNLQRLRNIDLPSTLAGGAAKDYMDTRNMSPLAPQRLMAQSFPAVGAIKNVLSAKPTFFSEQIGRAIPGIAGSAIGLAGEIALPGLGGELSAARGLQGIVKSGIKSIPRGGAYGISQAENIEQLPSSFARGALFAGTLSGLTKGMSAKLNLADSVKDITFKHPNGKVEVLRGLTRDDAVRVMNELKQLGAKVTDVKSYDAPKVMGIYGGKNATGFKNEGSFSSMADKKTRFEIDDSKLSLKNIKPDLDGFAQRATFLEDILDHPTLYKEYPELRKMDVDILISPEIKTSTRGSFQPYENRKSQGLFDLQPMISIRAKNINEAKSTLLHEIQHAIQEKEGFARGGSPTNALNGTALGKISDDEYYGALGNIQTAIDKRLNEAGLTAKIKQLLSNASDENINEFNRIFKNDPILHRLEMDRNEWGIQKRFSDNPFKAYQSLAGEVEARDVQARMNLTPEQRATTQPYQSQGIPVKDQIVRFDGGVSASKDVTKGRLSDVGEAIKYQLEKQGTKVNPDNTVTLYHATSPENLAKIQKEGFVKGGSTATGGMTGLDLEPSAFFGTDKKWTSETWGQNGTAPILEVKVPVEYIRQPAQNPLEVYFEGGLKRGKDGIWRPAKEPRSTFYDRLALKDYKNNVAQPPIGDINSKIDLERSINQNVQKIQKDFLDGKITIEQRKALAEREFARSTAQPPVSDVTKGVQTPTAGKARGFTTSVQEAPNVQKKVKGLVDSTYIPKRNTQLMGEAQALLQEGASIDLKNTQDIDKKITATMQEALSQQRKNPQLAANLYNNLAEKGTELGRGVQAFSLLNKMSPDAIALSAAGKIKAYNRTAVRKIPELTGDQVKLISKQVDVIKKLAEGSRERNIAVNNLSNTINDFIPSSFADKAIATWKAGLLTSLRTSERNIFGNTVHGLVEAVKDLPASLADRLMSGVTGKRTLTPTFQGAGEMYSKRTGQQISDVLRLGYDASEDISKFDHKRITWANTPVQQALKKYTDIVFRSLGAQDKPFYNSAFKRSLYSQAGAEAINIGQEGNRQIIQKLVESPTDEMIKTAISDANVATFKDKNSASSIANAIKREMAKVKLGDVEVGKIASEVFMPFTGVPTSILGQIANYSPIGLLKGIINTGKVLAQDVPELQRQAAHEIGRGVIGTGIFGLGSYLASKGLITGQPKDATEQRQWDLENKPRNSILINGKWRSLNSVGPEAVVFLAGAKLNEEMKNPEGSIGGYAGTLGKDYLDQSFVTGIQQPVNAITDPARYGKSYVGNQMASVMPNIGKDLAKSLDPLQREANTVTDYVKQATPLLRNTLIEKRDTLGNVMPQEPTGLGAFFDLFNSKTPVDNAVVNELSRLQKEGQSATPSKLTPNQTILKQKVKLTFEQLNQLEKGVGEALKPRLESLITSPNYQQLDDEQKAQAIDKIVQETRKQYKNLNASSITSGASPTTLPQGEMIPIVNKNGNVTMIDTSFQPERPKLTGQAELDKKLLSSYYGDITQKTNDIVALYKAGKLSANDANTQIAQLKALKGGGSKKVSLGKMRMPKLKKLKVYKMKKIKFKQIKLPKLSKLKATRV